MKWTQYFNNPQINHQIPQNFKKNHLVLKVYHEKTTRGHTTMNNNGYMSTVCHFNNATFRYERILIDRLIRKTSSNALIDGAILFFCFMSFKAKREKRLDSDYFWQSV